MFNCLRKVSADQFGEYKHTFGEFAVTSHGARPIWL